ncbi:MAG: hypothetical protein HN576_15345 [Bacteriovoracaceae bacterium]|jgi:endonuclease/exonuclease/phosphatase family metal-dependent hydrolase|nr:hypothetical protein [Bacteriovoracaceae bacterium]
MKSFIQSSLTLLLLLTAFNINASELKVMTYNIWGLPFPIAKRIKRFKVLKKIIAKQDVDFIGFQEAFTRTALKVTKHKNFPHVAYGPKKCLLNLSSGLVLISKYPIVKTDTIKYKECQGWDCRANKGVLFAQVNIKNELIDVYVTHLNAEGEDFGPRLSQMNQLIKFVQKNSTGNKTIFLGDFNFQPSSFLHDHMTTILGLNDSHQEYVLDNPDLSADERNGYTNRKLTKRIDYVWSSPELLVNESKVIMKERLYKNETLSDHKAVRTSLNY